MQTPSRTRGPLWGVGIKAKGIHPSCRTLGLLNFWHLWAKQFFSVDRFDIYLGLVLITSNFNLILFKVYTFINSLRKVHLFTLNTQIRRRSHKHTDPPATEGDRHWKQFWILLYWQNQSRIDVIYTTSIALWLSVVWPPSYFWHVTVVGATPVSLR